MADDDAWMGSPSKRDPAWALRRDPPRFVLIPHAAPHEEERLRLLFLWAKLPPFSFLFEQIGRRGESAVQFAAIDWTAAKSPLGSGAATLGVLFTRVFDFVAVCAPRDELGWFACPFVRLDIEGVPRVGFWPPTQSADRVKRVAPEAIDQWPHLDERGMVYAVGQLLMDTVVMTRADLAHPLAAVIRTCLMTDPARRYQSLKELRTALAAVGGATRWSPRVADKGWAAVERGVGYLATEQWQDALNALLSSSTSVSTPLVKRGIELALSHGARPREVPSPASVWGGVPARQPVVERTWPEVAVAGARLEAARDPHGALALYMSVRDEAVHRVPYYLALARTWLATGDHGHAIEYAGRLTPTRESLAIIAKGWIAKREHAKALEAIDRWEVLAPDDAAVAYQRGKALLGLSRLPEARAAFDTALARDGKMIEAMLLRREVDRHMGRSREVVGTQQQQALPPALVALIGAEPAAALSVLAEPRFADDPVAQLMRAELLCGEQRYADALGCYDVAMRELPQARRGKARALLELGRTEEALAALGDATDMATVEMRAWIQGKVRS